MNDPNSPQEHPFARQATKIDLQDFCCMVGWDRKDVDGKSVVLLRAALRAALPMIWEAAKHGKAHGWQPKISLQEAAEQALKAGS